MTDKKIEHMKIKYYGYEKEPDTYTVIKEYTGQSQETHTNISDGAMWSLLAIVIDKVNDLVEAVQELQEKQNENR